MDKKRIEHMSELFKALGHPARLAIVTGLMKKGNDGCNVTTMVEKLGLPQSTVSQHLTVLRHAGIIEPEKNGVKTCYRVVDKDVLKILGE